MSKSRSIYVICILMMLCLTVCSCAVPNTDSSVSDPVKTQAPSATSSAAEQSDVSTDGAPDAVFPLEETLDITVYTQLASKFAGSVDNLSSLLLFDIIREKCNVNFIFEHASASLASEQYGLMFASGDYADVIAMYRDSFYPGGLGAAYQDGIIISLNDLMDQGLSLIHIYLYLSLKDGFRIARYIPYVNTELEQTFQKMHLREPFIYFALLLWLLWARRGGVGIPVNNGYFVNLQWGSSRRQRKRRVKKQGKAVF